MQRKRPHWEREELLQVFLLGAAAANPKLLDDLVPSDFTGAWAECVAQMQRAKKKEPHTLDSWLERHLGIRRVNGSKAVDSALERFRQDAEFRKAVAADPYGAQLARLMAEMRDRQLRK